MNELSKSLRCVVMRNGIELWLEADKADSLQHVLLNTTQHKFVKFGERTINTADISGIFVADDMATFTRRKNGEWQCGKAKWHAKGQQCDCSRSELPNWTKMRMDKEQIGNYSIA